MDGVLLIHASSGHVLFSKAYTEGFGIKREAQRQSHSTRRGVNRCSGAIRFNQTADTLPLCCVCIAVMCPPAGDSSKPKDPLIVSMLLANFLCALYTNVINMIELADGAADAETASSTREQQIDAMMHDPLSSFDTGTDGPLLFFKRDASCPSVFLVLFLRRALIDGSSAEEGHAADADCAECMRSLGTDLADRLLRSFLAAYGAELRGSSTGSSGAKAASSPSTKHFRPWLNTLESIYASSDFAHSVLDRIVDRIAAQFQPRWIYVLHARDLLTNMEKACREKHATSAAARKQNAPAAVAPAAAVGSVPHKRRASNGVADASSIVAQPPAFVPRPPSQPSPAAIAAAAAAGASASSGAPVAPVPSSSIAGGRFYSSTRPLSVRAGSRFPFAPAPAPRRRWWHFGRGSSGNTEQLEPFWRDVGRTTCFYALAPASAAEAAVTGTEAEERGAKGEEESKQQAPQTQPFASSFAPLPSPMPSPSPSPSPVSGSPVAAAVADPSLPSPVALHKLVSLLYNAGLVLSAPSEVADALSSMELTLTLPAEAASNSRPLILQGHPAPFVERARVKLMVLRVAGMIIALPSPIVQQQSTASSEVQLSPPPSPPLQSLSLPALLSAVRPLLRCVETHFAFVASLHDRADKAMRKELEKLNAGKQKAK